MGQSQHTMDEFHVERFVDKFKAAGWYAIAIDGHDYSAITAAFEEFKTKAGRPATRLDCEDVQGQGCFFRRE
jgi:transketolase N-terminal domain/subunit